MTIGKYFYVKFVHGLENLMMQNLSFWGFIALLISALRPWRLEFHFNNVFNVSTARM